MSLLERPTHCTRRRMKPYIDSCECEWCKQLDQEFEDAMRDRSDFDPTDQSLVGRKARWAVYSIIYTGTIKRVLAVGTKSPYRPGDWFVAVDGGGDAVVQGMFDRLVREGEE